MEPTVLLAELVKFAELVKGMREAQDRLSACESAAPHAPHERESVRVRRTTAAVDAAMRRILDRKPELIASLFS